MFRYGYLGSAMPARPDTLAEEQGWNGINYVRATFGTRTDQTPAGSDP